MAAPAYIGNGGIGASDNSATVAVPFPTLEANDILLLQLLSAENDTHQQPTGFTALGTQVNESTNQTSSWWWKRAAGTESGNLTCSRTNSGDAFFGIMSNWRGARLTGTPFNYAGPTSGNSNAYSSSAITPTYDYSAVICLCNEENNVALGLLTDYSAEAFDVANTTGDDVEFNACYIYQTTKAAVAAKTGTITNAQSWATITLALWSPIPTTVNATCATATATGYDPTIQAVEATVVSATKGAATGASYAATVQADVDVTVTATKGTATGTSYAATVEADVDLTIEVGGGGTGKNLWTNADLEAGIDDWNGDLNCTISWSNAQAWQETYSVKGVIPSNAYSYITSDVKSIVSGSTQYTASLYVRPTNGSMPLALRILDQDDNQIAALSAATYTADTWSRMEKPFTTGSDDTGIRLRFLKSNSAEVGDVYLDGVQVELGGLATTWENYSVAGGPDAITVTGYDATLKLDTLIPATKGTASATGLNPTLQIEEPITVTCTKGTATGSAYAAAVQADVDTSVAATVGTATGTVYAATIQADVDIVITATLGTATATGNNSTLNVGTSFVATIDTITGASYGVSVNAVTGIAATAAAAVVTGYDATLLGIPTVISATCATATATGYDVGVGGFIYYMRADGAATKANAIGPETDVNACMNVTTHNAATFAPDDIIVVSDDGGNYTTAFNTPSAGSVGAPITYVASGTPVIHGGIDATSATYKWTASGSGTNEYYLEAAAGGTPGLTEAKLVTMDGVNLTPGTLGSLADHEWNWGNNDTLGFNTIYVRDDSGDPDTSGVEIIVSQLAYLFWVDQSYVTIDGLTFKYSNNRGVYAGSGTPTHVVIKNCTFLNNVGHSIQMYTGMDDWELRDSEFAYGIGTAIGLNGTYGNYIYRFLMTGCTVHDHYLTSKSTTGEPSGLKAFGMMDSTIEKSTWYTLPLGGIRLDGWTDPYGGCDGNLIADNLCYDTSSSSTLNSAIMLEFSGGNTVTRNYCHSPSAGSYCIAVDHQSSSNVISYNVCEGATATNSAGIVFRYTSGEHGANLTYGNTIYNCARGISYNQAGADYGDTLKNNIVLGSTAGPDLYTDSLTIISDYNCFSSDGFNTIKYTASTWYTLAQWYSASGQDEHSLETDPLLKDAPNGKFYLTSTSPCIDVGADLGATYDDGLNPNLSGAGWPDSVKTLDQDSWGTGWEIGAYVYDYADVAAATATAYAATVLTGGQTIVATKGAAATTGYDVVLSADVVISSTSGSVAVTGYAATVQTDTGIVATVDTATASAFAATVEADVDTTVITSSGAITATSNAATVLALEDVTVSATLGTATATGYDVGLAADLVIPCTSDAVTGAGYDASILLEAGIAVSCGSITGSAFAATVEADVDTTVTASAGTATGTAYAATVQADVDVAVLVTAGTATATDYAAVVNIGTGITATVGAATATGYDVALAADNNITATLGAATATGNAAGVSVGSFITADVAAATATAYDPTVLAAMAIPATAGSATATGYDATIAADLVIPVTLGAITVAGYGAGVEAETLIGATVANAVATAFNAGISGITAISATKASATLTGYDASLGADVTITATLGTAAITALDALLSTDVAIVATKGTVTVTGCNPAILLPIDITASKGEATATAYAATVNVGTSVAADSAAATATAHNPVVYWPLGIEQTSTATITTTGLDATIFEGIINITCGTITVTAKVPTVTIPFRFLISPTITSSSISYTTTSNSIDYTIEELA